MRILSNGVEIPDEDNFIWEAYNDRCLMCIYQLAHCLHECPPKSRNPHWIEQPETRFPLCNQHHLQVHEMSWKAAQNLLIGNRNAYFPDAERRLREHE